MPKKEKEKKVDVVEGRIAPGVIRWVIQQKRSPAKRCTVANESESYESCESCELDLLISIHPHQPRKCQESIKGSNHEKHPEQYNKNVSVSRRIGSFLHSFVHSYIHSEAGGGAHDQLTQYRDSSG